MKIKLLALTVLCIVLFFLLVPDLNAVTLEGGVQDLESQIDRLATTGLVLFLFGVFCAYWAQENERSAWGWFFLGLFFGPITGAVLLAKNSKEKKGPEPQA